MNEEELKASIRGQLVLRETRLRMKEGGGGGERRKGAGQEETIRTEKRAER